jgi:hypothetical protein
VDAVLVTQVRDWGVFQEMEPQDGDLLLGREAISGLLGHGSTSAGSCSLFGQTVCPISTEARHGEDDLMPDSSDTAKRSWVVWLCQAGVSLLLIACAVTVLVDRYGAARTENSLAAIQNAGGFTMRDERVRSRPVIGIDLDAATVLDTGEVRRRGHVTDDTLRIVAGFGELRELSLDGADVTDAGLMNLSRLIALRRLNLSRTHVTDAGLVHLKRMSELRSLDLRGTRVTIAGIRELERALPGAKVLVDPADTGAQP